MLRAYHIQEAHHSNELLSNQSMPFLRAVSSICRTIDAKNENDLAIDLRFMSNKLLRMKEIISSAAVLECHSNILSQSYASQHGFCDLS